MQRVKQCPQTHYDDTFINSSVKFPDIFMSAFLVKASVLKMA